MASNRREHLRYRYGICLNDSCPKCKSKEVQQIPARKDLVCAECGKNLRECPPPKTFWDKYGKLITIGAAIVVIASAIVAYLALFNNKPAPKGEDEPVDTAKVDTATVVKEPVDTPAVLPVDSGVKDSADTVAPVTEPAAQPDKNSDNKGKSDEKGKTVQPPAPPASPIRVSFGNYSGPASGLDGEIEVTRYYTLDLRNAAHETIELQPGDVITKTKFKNGELVGGFWRRGSQGRSFHR